MARKKKFPNKIDLRLPEDIYEWVEANAQRDASNNSAFVRKALSHLMLEEEAAKYNNTVSSEHKSNTERKAAQ